jgi:transcriptional regulator with XRE-family HTH domain
MKGAQSHRRMTVTTELGEMIRTARLRQGWSQAELGERVGSSKKSVGQWERTGRISPLSLGRLTKALGISAPDGEWVQEEPQQVETKHFTSYSFDAAQLSALTGPEAPLDALRRIRRELTRLTADLDKALEVLGAND